MQEKKDFARSPPSESGGLTVQQASTEGMQERKGSARPPLSEPGGLTVQQGRGNGALAQPQLRHEARSLHQVDQDGLAARAKLAGVRRRGYLEGPHDDGPAEGLAVRSDGACQHLRLQPRLLRRPLRRCRAHLCGGRLH